MAKKNYIEKPFSCVREGLTIRGKVYEPLDKSRANAEGKLPVAIVSHMFLVNSKMVAKYAKFFANNGYLSVCYDFNGGGAFCKSDGKSIDMSVLTEVKDLEAVIAAMLSRADADASRLTLMGCSQGGFVSALVAAKNEVAVEKLIMFYPALSIPDDARKGQMLMAKFDPKAPDDIIKCGFMKLGKQYVTDVIEMDAFETIAAYEGPVLIVHGTADDKVPFENSEKAVKAYKNARLEPIEGAGHAFLGKNSKTAFALLAEVL